MNLKSKSFLMLLSFLLSTGSLSYRLQADDLTEKIPLTMGNLQGHKNLYNEGWFVVTSSKEALEYAYKQSYTSSSQVWQKIAIDLKERKIKFKEAKLADTKRNEETSQQMKASMESYARTIDEGLEQDRLKLKDKSRDSIRQAYESFVLGYVQLQERTAADVKELKAINGNFFSNLKDDFSNYYEIVSDIDRQSESKLIAAWQKSFLLAGEEFEKEYKESGVQSNSIAALWSLAKGYSKATYYAVLKPSAATTVGAFGAGYKLTERVIMNTGRSFFYASSIGYKVVSPTIEAGYLSALSLVSWSGEKLTHGTQVGLFAFNQVAVASSQPVYSTGKWLVSTTVNTADYAAASTYDMVSGASQIAVNQVKAGAVLGYNALTALPTQTLLACMNSVVFLAWDGPKLAIYSLKGEVNGVPVQELPVGTILDKEKAEKLNLRVEKISDEPKLIEAVIESPKEDH
jgi:hypothetical protein